MPQKIKHILSFIQVCCYVLGGAVFAIISQQEGTLHHEVIETGFLASAILLKLLTMICWDELTFGRFINLQRSFLVPYTILGVAVYNSIALGILIENSDLSNQSFQVAVIPKSINLCLSVVACSLLIGIEFISPIEFYLYVLVNAASVLSLVYYNLFAMLEIDTVLAEKIIFFISEVTDNKSKEEIGDIYSTLNNAGAMYLIYSAYVIAYKLAIMDELAKTYVLKKALIRQQLIDLKPFLKDQSKPQNQTSEKQAIQTKLSDLRNPQLLSNLKKGSVQGDVPLTKYMATHYILILLICICFFSSNMLFYAIPILDSYQNRQTENYQYLSQTLSFVLSKAIAPALLILFILIKICLLIRPLRKPSDDQDMQTTLAKQYSVPRKVDFSGNQTNRSDSEQPNQLSTSQPRPLPPQLQPIFTWKQFLELQFAFVVPYTVMVISCWTTYQTYELYQEYESNQYTAYSQGLSIVFLILVNFSVSLTNSVKTLSSLEYYFLTCTLFIGNLLHTFQILRVIFSSNEEVDAYNFPVYKAYDDSNQAQMKALVDEVKGLDLIKDLRMFHLASLISGLLIQMGFLASRKQEIEDLANRQNENSVNRISYQEEQRKQQQMLEMKTIYRGSIGVNGLKERMI